jgi:hypothetical protein
MMRDNAALQVALHTKEGLLGAADDRIKALISEMGNAELTPLFPPPHLT